MSSTTVSAAQRVALGLLHASPMPMLLWWEDAGLPGVGNSAYQQLLAQPSAAWTEPAWAPADWSQMQTDLAQVRRTGQAVWRENLPLPLPHTPVGEYCGTYSYNPILDERGVAGVLFMCSRHYRASTVHEDGRFGYAAVIHSMDLGFAIVEALETAPGELLDYRFVEINSAWERQTGLAATRGMRASEIVRPRQPFWPQLIAEVLRTGESDRASTQQGTGGRSVDVFAMRLGGEGSRQVALVARDVSAQAQAVQALKRSEQRARTEAERAEAERKRLNAVLETTPAPVFVVDAQGQFIHANSRARADWGHHPYADHRQWMGWWADGSDRTGQRLTPDDWPLVRALRGQACQDVIEIASPTHSRQRKVYLVAGAPILGAGGQIEGAVVTATDISTQVQAEREMQEAHQRKDEFLAMLAHELRNPLAPIRAAAELMGRPQAGKELMLRTSAIIARQVQHMTELVDDLLDMSRVSRGTISLNKEFLDTRAVVSDALEQVAPMLRQRKHQLEVLPPEQPLLFEGDRKRVIQVLSNLLSNAIKYTPPGGHIRLTVAQVGDRLEFRVEDNGQGMDSATLARAFELFAQAKRSSDREQGGLGIGLALVKKLVELHGGEVRASSEGVGRGSQFVACLPLCQGMLPTTVSERPARRKKPQQMQVMVVDDHIDGAQTLAMLIESDGHRCQVAHAPGQALALLAQQTADALILDIGLPEMDGRELARRLRAREETAQALLIALSGYAQPKDRQAALDAGFDHYLIKPVDTMMLLDLLSAHAARVKTGQA